MDARARYDEICDDLAARNAEVTLGQMMGMPALMAGGKMIGGFPRAEEAMVFKLPDEQAHADALRLDGAHLFDPSGRGQPFREWVVVPSAHASEWPRLAAAALSQRTGGP